MANSSIGGARAKLRKYFCENLGNVVTSDDLRKKVRLQIDHILPISQGGTDDEHNLRAVCVYYNKDKTNILKPASGQSISAPAMVRKLPRNVQIEVYERLRKKFGDGSGRKK